MDRFVTLQTLPVSGPISTLALIVREIAQAAEQPMLDAGRVEAGLRTLARQLETGELDENAFEEQEARLLAELDTVTEHRNAAYGGLVPEARLIVAAAEFRPTLTEGREVRRCQA